MDYPCGKFGDWRGALDGSGNNGLFFDGEVKQLITSAVGDLKY